MSCPSSVIANIDDHAVVQHDHAPATRDASPPESLVDYQDTPATSEGDGEEPNDTRRYCDEQLAGGGGGEGGSDDPTVETAVIGGDNIPSQDVAINNNASRYTSRFDEVCRNLNRQQLEECADLLLELLGWGVPLEYITDSGFSLPGVIWLCAKLKIRLSWGIVKRARQACIPLHDLSILPEGYVEPKAKSPPPLSSFAPPA